MDDEDGWFDEGDELPILPVDGVADDQPLAPPHRRRRPWSPRGGVPVGMAADTRRAALAEATGREVIQQGDQWRDDMAAGDRDRAASSLETGGRRRGGRGGFGLA